MEDSDPIHSWISDYNRWAGLANVAATGHIGTLEFEIVSFFVKRQPPSKEDVKAVWDIAEKFMAVIFNDDLELVSRVQIQGGKGADPKMTWEDAYKTLCHLPMSPSLRLGR